MQIQDSNPRNSSSSDHSYTSRHTVNVVSVKSPAKMVRLKPSRYGLYVTWLLLFVASVSVCVANIHFYVQCLLLMIILLHLKQDYKQWQVTPVYRVQCLHDDWWLLVEGERAQQHDYKITTWSFWSPWLLVLTVVDKQGKSKSMPVYRDCCSKEEFRWFRVVVKYIVLHTQ